MAKITVRGLVPHEVVRSAGCGATQYTIRSRDSGHGGLRWAVIRREALVPDQEPEWQVYVVEGADDERYVGVSSPDRATAVQLALACVRARFRD